MISAWWLLPAAMLGAAIGFSLMRSVQRQQRRTQMIKTQDAIAAARALIGTPYKELDCYKDTYGTVYRCLLDNTVHDAKDLPTSLEVVS